MFSINSDLWMIIGTLVFDRPVTLSSVVVITPNLGPDATALFAKIPIICDQIRDAPEWSEERARHADDCEFWSNDRDAGQADLLS